MPKIPFRKIIHLDLDAFFCAVEELRDPSLRGKPFAVGGSPTGRGVVTSASYAARRNGVRSAMPMARAVKICPGLIRVSSRFSNYTKKSKEVRQIMLGFTDLVQPISIDEAFLDFSQFEEPGEYFALELQRRILNEAHLPCSLGVATNMLVAKIATNVGKASLPTDTYPNAIQVVPPGEEAAFLAPLPTEALWGVGPKTGEALDKLGIKTIGDIAAYPSDELRRRFGKTGHSLSRRAKGMDERPISMTREAKSVSHETTFRKDVSNRKQLEKAMQRHCNSISSRLQKAHVAGITVKVKLRWTDFKTITRQLTLEAPTDGSDRIYEAARKIFKAHWPEGKPVRLIGVGVTGLMPPSRQLSLWDVPKKERERRLQSAIDELRDRYGNHSIHLGQTILRETDQ